ncbi:MAG: ABC transporter ATP-binding protein/permease [Lachnospiraceae bacterium]|nr:ABC transporter ATP-binding protein/permease [Lachnospiraceae bacterium]
MKTLRKNIGSIVWICKPFLKYGKVYIILSVCISAIYTPIDDLIYVRFPEVMIDMLSAGRGFALIALVAVLFCIADFLNNTLRKLSRAYFTKKQAAIEVEANQEIYEKARELDYRYIDNPQYYNSYTWAVDEYAKQMDSARELLITLSQCVLSLAVLVTIVGTLGPWILLIEVVQLFLHTRVNLKLNANMIERKETLLPLERRLKYFHRLFYMKDYAADLKATSLGSHVLAAHRETGEQRVEKLGFFALRGELWNVVHEVIFFATQLIIVLYLAQSILSGRIAEVGMYMTLLLSFYRLDTRIDILTNALRDANGLSMNVEKIRAFFDLKSQIETGSEAKGFVPERGSFSVELKNVGFSYENSDFSLSGLNLVIRPGEKIAVVGENGAGKSTFVKLLLRLCDVREGEISINGRPIREYDVHSLRGQIGVAFQNTNIYAMSLLENISLYGEVSERALKEASAQLGLDEIMEKNHMTLLSQLTREFHEDGVLLSGGEAQRVGLARVMSGEFGLLLLDEPSSALDPIAEAKMSEAILSAANQTTTIMIAHRLSTIRDADRIVVFDRGRICECGSHGELMSLHGKYWEMFTRQAENYVKG